MDQSPVSHPPSETTHLPTYLLTYVPSETKELLPRQRTNVAPGPEPSPDSEEPYITTPDTSLDLRPRDYGGERLRGPLRTRLQSPREFSHRETNPNGRPTAHEGAGRGRREATSSFPRPGERGTVIHTSNLQGLRSGSPAGLDGSN